MTYVSYYLPWQATVITGLLFEMFRTDTYYF